MKRKQTQPTKTLIMNAAERLFAMHGFEATSLRAITAEAKVNLGAVNYHFATKDALIVAVLMRRMRPLNDQRLALLDQREAAAGKKPLTVEQILDTLFRPTLEMLAQCSKGGQTYLRLIGLIIAEPGDYLIPLIKEEFAEKMNRFQGALSRSLPKLSAEEIYWKLHLTMGAFVQTVARSQILELMSHGQCRLKGIDDTLAHLIPFCSAGFKAGGNTGKS